MSYTVPPDPSSPYLVQGGGPLFPTTATQTLRNINCLQKLPLWNSMASKPPLWSQMSSPVFHGGWDSLTLGFSYSLHLVIRRERASLIIPRDSLFPHHQEKAG